MPTPRKHERPPVNIANLVEDPLLPPEVVSEILGMTIATLSRWRCEKRNLAYVRMGGGSVRYQLSEVNRFVESQRVDIPKAS